MFPDVQQKVYEEIKYIDSLIDNDPSRIDIKILDQMEYLNKVILESLRLFSSSTIIGRYSTGNIKLKTKNLVIPEGVFLIVGFSMCHRNKKYWGPDAHKFNPENFSKENIRNRHPNAFIAFSGGPRNCVGLKFADLSMKMILYKILRNYQLSTDEIFNEIRCEFHLLMKKVGGWNIKINPRM
jgi:cytochrome P450